MRPSLEVRYLNFSSMSKEEFDDKYGEGMYDKTSLRVSYFNNRFNGAEISYYRIGKNTGLDTSGAMKHEKAYLYAKSNIRGIAELC